MNNQNQQSESLEQMRQERLDLQNALEESERELTTGELEQSLHRHQRLRKRVLGLVATSSDQDERIALVVEVVRSLETELIHLHRFLVAPEDQEVALAQRLETLLEEMSESGTSALSRLEISYFLGILSIYEGELEKARGHFEATCESEESDETNDIKYKSFVMLGHLSHVEQDYERARDLHEKSLQYTRNDNVMAQALALKALNSYALQKTAEALEMFEKALDLFRVDEPFYNEYFHRNSLLFCGSILFDREDYDRAGGYYEQVLDHVDRSSYDYFDALVQLGKIRFSAGQFEEAAKIFQQAIEQQSNENEYLLDTLYWLARAQLKNERRVEARECLEKVVSSSVDYQKKPQAEQLLAQVS